MRIRSGALLSLVMLAAIESTRAETPRLPDVDRVRLAEAFRLADAVGNKIWPDWGKAPFAVLLVTDEHEFLLRHPQPSGDFTLIGEDTLLKSEVWRRKRMYSSELLATFPAVGGVPTIVIGQAENTAAKTSTRWVITLLHEHFHQLQYSQPGYYADVDALGLARGDQTGMWMLNYAFPYTAAEVKNPFEVMCKSLAAALEAKDQPDFAEKVAFYLDARNAFQSRLNDDDYKYSTFQEWQEGIARYTEYQVARLAAAEYRPSKAFKKLRDYISFKEEARAILREVQEQLSSVKLEKAQRTAFYALGAAEGLVLDRAHPGWREQYWGKKFLLDEHFRGEE